MYGLDDLRKKYTTKNEGISGLANHGTKTIIDKKIIPTTGKDHKYLKAVRIILTNQDKDDTIRLAVVDKEYLYAGVLYPADYNGTPWNLVFPNGVELDWFGSTWNVVADSSDQGKEDPGYWSLVPAGVYITFEYDSKGIEDVIFKCNLDMQEDK